MTAAARPTVRSATQLLQPRVSQRIDYLQLSLFAVLLTYVWRIQDLIPGLSGFKLPTIVTVAALAMIVLDPRVGRRWAIIRRLPVVVILPWFAVAAVVSVFFSISQRTSADFLVRGFLPSIALAVLVPLASFHVRDSLRFAAIQVLGASVYCISFLMRSQADATGRLASQGYYDSNDTAMLLVCTLPLCIHLFRHARTPITRALVLALVALFLTTIARSESRGAFLGLLAVAVYLLCTFRSLKVSTRAIMVGALGASLLVGAGVKYRETIASILDPTDYNWNSAEGRVSIWKRGLGYVASSPVAGVGIGAFPVAEGTLSPLAQRQEYGKGVKWSTAHNSFLQVLAEIGIPGFIAFCAIFWAAWRHASRLARQASRLKDKAVMGLADAHAASLVGFAVTGFFLSQGYSPYLYFVIGMIVALEFTMRAAWLNAPPATWPQAIAARRRARAATFRPEPPVVLPPVADR
jgi:putative inorganic carbon (HCO3(-)) transporter